MKTIVDLTEGQRLFLKKRGNGKIKRGLELALKELGYREPESLDSNYKASILRDFNFQKETYTYQLLIGNKAIQSLHISQASEQLLMNQYGEKIFFGEIILKGLLAGPLWQKYGADIKFIRDAVSGKILWKQQPD